MCGGLVEIATLLDSVAIIVIIFVQLVFQELRVQFYLY